jgi:hypothetical protein
MCLLFNMKLPRLPVDYCMRQAYLKQVFYILTVYILTAFFRGTLLGIRLTRVVASQQNILLFVLHKRVNEHLQVLIPCIQTEVYIIVSHYLFPPFGLWPDCFPPINISQIAGNTSVPTCTPMLINERFCLQVAPFINLGIEQVPLKSNCPPYHCSISRCKLIQHCPVAFSLTCNWCQLSALKKPTHAVSNELLVATKLITLLMSTQKQLISQPPSSSSTVSCQLPMHGS